MLFHIFSSSFASHRKLVETSKGQKPDAVLRQRTCQGHFINNSYEDSRVLTDPSHGAEKGNSFVKVAVWTLTLSMGAMTFLVLNAAKKWV